MAVRSVSVDLHSVEGTRLSVEETVKAVAIPPVEYDKVPRVEHFVAPFTGPVSSVVSHSLQLPTSFVDALVRFGAVYACPVIPHTAPSLSTEAAAQIEEMRAEAVSRVGRNPKFRQPRRVTSGEEVHQNAYCRVHVHPKRFPAYYEHDWSERVLFENAHCVVVNKPPGCQVPPRVDNQLECLTRWIQDLLKLDMELKPVHRLDTGTEGVVVLAKTVEFARYFQKLLRGDGGSVEKGYRALTMESPLLGTLQHYIKDNHHTKGAPRRSLVSAFPFEGAAYAEMKVIARQPVTLCEKARQRWGVAKACESMIELKTGRTHQIRVQLAYKEFPLLGDGLYQTMPLPEARTESIGVRDDCIGLQAATLMLKHDRLQDFFEEAQNDTMPFSAGDPWWRCS